MLNRTDTLFHREYLRAAKKALQELGRDTTRVIEYPFTAGRPGHTSYAEGKVVGNRVAIAALIRVLGEVGP